MAASSPISNDRPRHRTPRAGPDAIDSCYALDWANGQVIAAGAASAAGVAFDASNDALVMVSSNVGCWITVGAAPTAVKATAGNMYVSPSAAPFPVYVPAGFTIAAIEDTATAGTLSAIPALIAM